MAASTTLSSDDALVLYGWLNERRAAVTLFDENDRPVCAEELVLNRIQGQLEKALVEPADPAYLELLAAARQRILENV